MIECYNCKKTIWIDDQYCKYCGAKQDAEKNKQDYFKQTMQPSIDKYVVKYSERDWFSLLWKDVEAKKEFSNLSGFGNQLMLLEAEKERFEIEMEYATTPKSYERKRYSYEIRIKNIAELVDSLEKMKKSQSFLLKSC